MYFNRRDIALGLTIAACLALIIPSWRYATNLVEGLRPHCVYETHSFTTVWNEAGTAFELAAPTSPGACLSPDGSSPLYYGPAESDVFLAAHAAGSAIGDTTWQAAPALAASWFGAFLRVSGQFYGFFMFGAGATLVVYIYVRSSWQTREWYEESDG